MNGGPHERFRAWIDWLGLSQKKVGARLGCDQSYVSNLLSGKLVKPNVDVAVAIERESEDWPSGPLRVVEWADEPVRQSA